MSSLDRRLTRVWAKTNRGQKQQSEYHPLICHMIDVAAVTGAMWDGVLTPALRERIAGGLGLDEVAARAWVIFLAGLHDIGKASPVFQQKDRDQARRERLRDELRAVGLTWQKNPDDPGHGAISAMALRAILCNQFGVDKKVAATLSTAVGGHHGSFPADGQDSALDAELCGGDERWRQARRDLATVMAEELDLPKDVAPVCVDHPTAMVLAGLVSVADWMGSDEDYFGYVSDEVDAGTFDVHAYRQRAEAQAATALKTLGWLGWTPSDTPLAFGELFPELPAPPRPVQAAVSEIPGLGAGPGLVIIESPMGEGKTEAAFYLADRWGAALGQRGTYVAMPTMATSNQMFGRLRAFLERRYPDSTLNLQLLHSQSAISSELEALSGGDAPLLGPAEIYGDDGQRATAQVLAAEWFTKRKRGLLAPFGVGTVDQSLLAALQTRHVFVRIFGLAGKTIVFDEVHAYDTYMSTLFERLLVWLGAVGSSVVILSATLPRSRREKLMAAYSKGAGVAIEAAAPHVAYPRLSWLTPTGAGALHVPASAHASRTLHIGWIDGEPDALATHLKEQLRHGGCAAVICNTVGRAQKVYLALKDAFGDDELDLLHSRFPFAERAEREAWALALFGKPVKTEGSAVELVERPKRAVLVATQVIEQSLDLDFDVMVSDLAPVDLLLQRSGRLWRHQRPRPEGMNRPVLWVVRPTRVTGDVPTIDSGSEAVYDPHTLLRTWLAVRNCETVAIPGDIETMIEVVYGDDACPETASDELRARWAATRAKQEADVAKEQVEAEARYLKLPSPKLSLARITGAAREEDAPELHAALQALTRLIPPTAQVVCLYQTARGVALDKAGRQAVNLNVTPKLAEARLLLGRAVSISNRRIVFSLLEEEPPPGWQRSALLQHHRALIFDEEGVADVQTRSGTQRVRLDDELGIVFEDANGTEGQA